jgi:alpha-D-xyloside xylohydrolase
VRVQVYGDSMLRVTATAEDSLSERESLIAVADADRSVPFKVRDEQDRSVVLSTAKLSARISLETGEIEFRDSAGNLLVKELSGGGKRLESATVMDEETYHVRQVFESPEDEAFYGLGQHQNGLMNVKGHNVDLKQYNLVSVVPFLISSRNYGILWDNTSRTKYGDVRDFEPISSSLKLFDAQGNSGGFTAEYFSDNNFSAPMVSRVESIINHESLQDQEGYPEGFEPNGRGSVRWSGSIQSDIAGVHTLRFYFSNYAKLWIDGELMVDSWRQNWCPWERLVQLPMEAGKRYSVKLEWIPNGGYVGLKHRGPAIDPANTMSLSSEVGDAIDYYVIQGDNVDQIISGYRSLTGQAPMMPKWAMGLWQCRERYKTQEELLGVVREFRERGLPLDNIVQDWNYWPEDQWGSHDFDASRFLDPEAMIDELHNELNVNIMISVWPKFYVGIEHYNQFEENGWLYMRNVEKQERDWIAQGYVSTFYDPYSEGARELFWEQINDKLFSKGIDAWWLDATEPDIHSNLSEDEYMKRIGPTALGSSARYRNSYSLMNAKGIYEGQREETSDKRVFILPRSAYAGQQRFSAATWSGDVASRWDNLKEQIPAGLNFCLSGIPYWTTDIGGFAVEPRFENPRNAADLDEWRELQTRWFQYGTFCPLFRVHGQSPVREMFNIAPEDHPAYQSMAAYDELRYRLMPYIYSLSGMVTQDDYTIMRALVMDFGKDPKVRNIADQFMFGPALLINPVTDYKARERTVYLPAGAEWYDLKTAQRFVGGQTINAAAPYSDIPIFLRAGSIIPFGPSIQYTAEKPADPIRLQVYIGADGSFSLYEDEGVNYNYEKGAFSRISFTYDEQTQTLTIGDREGQFPGMLEERTFEIVWVTPDRDVPGLDEQPDRSMVYAGEKIVVQK